MENQVTLSEIIETDKSIFINKKCLKPDYKVDLKNILHRNTEIRNYYYYLKDIFNEVCPNSLFIYGKPGLGKTLITEQVLEEVEKEAENRNIKLCKIYMRCAKKTPFGIIKTINENIPEPEHNTKNNINSIGEQTKYMQYLIDHYPGMILIVLDEIDKTTDPGIINEIIRIKSKLSGHNPCTINITNDISLKDTFTPDLKSVLAQNEIKIKPYDAEQLKDIIDARAKMAFSPNVVGEMVVPLCAALSAQENGDARKAIDLLRVAGEIAERRNSNIIEEIDVRNADELIDRNNLIDYIKDSTTQAKVTLLACVYVFESGKDVTMRNIYDLYIKLCKDLDVDVLTQRRMFDLIDEFDQLGVIESINVYKGRYGRKKIITKIVSPRDTVDALFNDYRLKPIKNKKPREYFRIW
jgi:cell division control protein 6